MSPYFGDLAEWLAVPSITFAALPRNIRADFGDEADAMKSIWQKRIRSPNRITRQSRHKRLVVLFAQPTSAERCAR